jgi:hypothetical protein
MSRAHDPNQLSRFDANIRQHVADLHSLKRCAWCGSTNHPIRSRGLCSSCYRRDQEQRKLARQVDNLPTKTPRNPHAITRHALAVANCAVELCKIEGQVIDDHLNQVDPIDLEQIFDGLAKTAIGSRRASSLYYGHTWWFSDFPPMQGIWLFHLVSLMIEELNRRDRRQIARVRNTMQENQVFDMKGAA